MINTAKALRFRTITSHMVPFYSMMLRRVLKMSSLFFSHFYPFLVGIIGEKDAIILNVQQDEPTESSGLKSEYSAGGFASVRLHVLMIVIFT